MKKILSLVLALALILSVFSTVAVAEATKSKENQPASGDVTDEEAKKAEEEAKKAAEEAAKKAAEAEAAKKAAEEAAKKAAEAEAAKKAAAEEAAKKAAEAAKAAEEAAKKAAEEAARKAQRAHNFGLGSGSGSNDEDKEPEIGIEFISDTDAAKAALATIEAAAKNNDILSAFPADIKEAAGTKSKINEMTTAQFTGECGKVTKNKVLNLKFNTKYGDGEEVLVLIGILSDPIEWLKFPGVGKADGSVDVTLPAEVFQKVMNDPFLVGVLSE